VVSGRYTLEAALASYGITGIGSPRAQVQERLHILPDNLVRIELKRPFGDGDAE